MLKKILSPDSCASCRICCGFYENEKWEMPILPENYLEMLERKHGGAPETELFGGNRIFKMTEKDGEKNGILYCPELTETGCALGDDKPFDCRVWPFRVMRGEENELLLTVSPLCGAVMEVGEDRLRAFVEDGFAEMMFDEAKERPEIVKPYKEGHKIVAKRSL